MSHFAFRIVFCLLLSLSITACSTNSWREASRASAKIAPDPQHASEAVIQVFAADAWGWRGFFAVHTWLAVKPANAEQYTVLEVIGWREKSGLPVVRIEQDVPDRYWYGAKPDLLLDVRGEKAERLIPQLINAARDYPWANEYRVFPGPNSNTFPAWLAIQVPELELELPFRAIGSGWAD